MKKLLLALLLTTNISYAIVEVQSISLEHAINTALQTNPQVKITKLDVELSKNDIKIKNRLQNPSVHTFQNIGKTSEANPQQIGVDYTVEILKRGFRKNTAQSNAQKAFENEKFQEQNLILEVKKAYIDVLLKKSNLDIILEQKDLSKELLESVQKNNAPKTDIIQAKIACNRAQMYYNIAQSELVFSKNRFNSVMNTSNIEFDTKENGLNDDYNSLMTISPKDNRIDFEKVKDYALLNRFDLLSAKKEVERAQNNLKEVKAKLIPDLELTGGYSYQTKGMSESGRFQSGAYVGARLVNIPLIYHYQPEIKNAQIEIEKAKLKYEDIQIDALRNITDAWEKYTITRENLNFYNKELLENSKELLEESKKSLDKNEIDITTFLVSKKLYLELILGYYKALSEYYISYAELLAQLNVQNIDNI